jgi:hypothetical protein
VQHLLVSSADAELAEGLRALLPAGAALVSAHGVDETLDLLGRSARVDAVVTDDPEVERAIREEVPGTLPVVVVPPGSSPDEVRAALAGPGAPPVPSSD